MLQAVHVVAVGDVIVRVIPAVVPPDANVAEVGHGDPGHELDRRHVMVLELSDRDERVVIDLYRRLEVVVVRPQRRDKNVGIDSRQRIGLHDELGECDVNTADSAG